MKEKELWMILNKIEEKEIKQYLSVLLMRNEDIMNDFRSKFISYFPQVTKQEYRNKILSAIEMAGGNDNYIDYRETRNYTHAMYQFIQESEKLLEVKNYDSSFDIIEVILSSIPDTDIDDSDGSTGDVASSCIEIIEDILGYSLADNHNVAHKILDYILDEIKTKRLYNYGIELYPLLNYFIDENQYLTEIRKALNLFLKKHEEESYIKNKYIEILNKIDEKEGCTK